MSLNESEIVDIISNQNFGMGDYQIQNYVLKSEVTNYRQIRQSLLELNARRDSILQMEVDQKRRVIKKKKIERNLETETDELERELLKIDLQEIDKDFEYAQKRIKLQQRECEIFLNSIQSNFKTKEELQEFLGNPEEERKYWIARMGKQAALDILCNGRISTGNMDSIAMMSEEDQVKSLQVAIQYSGLMNVGIAKLQDEMGPYLKKLADNSDKILPTFEGIENNLNIDLVQRLGYGKKSIQSSNQSEDL
jgi:flagellar motor protein MotB